MRDNEGIKMDNFVIYGAGMYGSMFYKTIKAAGSDVDYFIDQYIQKIELFDKKIYRLDKIPSKNVTVLVSVPSDEMNIINELKRVGFTKVVGFVDTLRLENLRAKSNHIIKACNSSGIYFGISQEYSKILIFKQSDKNSKR